MADDLRANLKQWLESGEVRLHPLTFPQRELWEASPVPPGDIANHICAFIQVKGRVTPEEVHAAIQKVVDRQDVLRLSFLPGKAQPVQMVRATGTAAFAYRELPPERWTQEALQEEMLAAFERPFDMLRGPLYRVEMLQRGPDDLILVFAIHHSIADGWTLGVFVQDLCAAYLQGKKGIATPLPPVAMSYAEWDAAERAFWQAAELEKRAAFWRPKLANLPRLWQRPADVNARAGKLNRWITAIPAELTIQIRDLAKRSGTTLFNTLLTAFQQMLSEWKGQNDIVVGSPVANRNRQAAKETMGYFSGVVPLRGRVDRAIPFPERARQVQEDTMEAFANAMPFAELVRALGLQTEPGHNPIFDVRFALQNHPIPDVDLPNLSVKLRMRSTGTARFDLACEVTEDGAELEVVWLYRASLFDLDEVKGLNERYQTILTGVSSSPASRSPAAV
jgi:NRPS condensation-like uncharacterized protein